MSGKKKRNCTTITKKIKIRELSLKKQPFNERIFPNLTANQEQAILLTLSGKHSREIANALGISTRTLYNWRVDKTFKKALEEEENRIISEMRETLRFVMVEAFNTLKRGIIGPDASPVLAFRVLKETGYLPIADEKFAEKKNVKKQIGLFLSDLREFLKDTQSGVYENDL